MRVVVKAMELSEGSPKGGNRVRITWFSLFLLPEDLLEPMWKVSELSFDKARVFSYKVLKS